MYIKDTFAPPEMWISLLYCLPVLRVFAKQNVQVSEMHFLSEDLWTSMSKLESSSIVATITTRGQTILGLEDRPDHTLGHCVMETGDRGLYVVLFQLRGGNSGKKSMVQVSTYLLSIYPCIYPLSTKLMLNWWCRHFVENKLSLMSQQDQ